MLGLADRDNNILRDLLNPLNERGERRYKCTVAFYLPDQVLKGVYFSVIGKDNRRDFQLLTHENLLLSLF